MGIYLITNVLNGHKYVGMSNKIKRRFMEHKCPSQGRNTVLGKAFRKYGHSSFKFDILEEVDTTESLPIRETYWIDKLQPEYNMNIGGKGNRCYKVSDSTKEKLRVIS